MPTPVGLGLIHVLTRLAIKIIENKENQVYEGYEQQTAPDRVHCLLVESLHDEHATLRSGLHDRSDCLVGWRTIPGMRLFGAVEFDNRNSFRRRVSVEALYFTTRGDNTIMPVERRERFGDLRSVLL